MTGIQRTGGTGAFRILAGLIVRAKGDVTVWLSELTWLNHSTIFADAGLRTATHPYCDCRTSQVRVDEMLAALEAIPSGEVVLFHGCCHNPCGADLSLEAWDAIAAIMSRRGLQKTSHKLRHRMPRIRWQHRSTSHSSEMKITRSASIQPV
jgi:aspartate aminotransferase